MVKNHYFGLILLNKLGKTTNKMFFFIKYKILTAYGFHIAFQFRDQVTPKGPVEGIGHPLGVESG